MAVHTHTPAPAARALLYRAEATPQFLEVPPMTFLMIDGEGDPNTAPAYHDAISALYSLSYAAKFAVKHATGVNYPVSPLEGLWWADDMASFSTAPKAGWRWTMMIAQPDEVTPELAVANQCAARRRCRPSNTSGWRHSWKGEQRRASIAGRMRPRGRLLTSFTTSFASTAPASTGGGRNTMKSI